MGELWTTIHRGSSSTLCIGYMNYRGGHICVHIRPPPCFPSVIWTYPNEARQLRRLGAARPTTHMDISKFHSYLLIFVLRMVMLEQRYFGSSLHDCLTPMCLLCGAMANHQGQSYLSDMTDSRNLRAFSLQREMIGVG